MRLVCGSHFARVDCPPRVSEGVSRHHARGAFDQLIYTALTKTTLPEKRSATATARSQGDTVTSKRKSQFLM